MGSYRRSQGAVLMKPRKVTYQTRSARARRQNLMKAGVWLFLALFVFSIVGVAIAFIKR